MKKKGTILFAAIILFASTTFASNITEPTKQIKAAFNQLFNKATDVKWEALSGFYIATFKQGEQYLAAYFNPRGAIEAVSKNIATTSLPLMLQNGLQVKLQNGWITESSELSGRNGTEYYVTVENATAKTVYQTAGNNWSVYKTTTK